MTRNVLQKPFSFLKPLSESNKLPGQPWKMNWRTECLYFLSIFVFLRFGQKNLISSVCKTQFRERYAQIFQSLIAVIVFKRTAYLIVTRIWCKKMTREKIAPWLVWSREAAIFYYFDESVSDGQTDRLTDGPTDIPSYTTRLNENATPMKILE